MGLHSWRCRRTSLFLALKSSRRRSSLPSRVGLGLDCHGKFGFCFDSMVDLYYSATIFHFCCKVPEMDRSKESTFILSSLSEHRWIMARIIPRAAIRICSH